MDNRYLVGGLLVVVAAGLLFAGSVNTASVIGSGGPDAVGNEFSSGGSSSNFASLLQAANVLGNSGCSDADYEYCTSNVNEFQWARAEAQLQVTEMDTVYTSDGVRYVEQGTSIRYKCGEPLPNDDISHTMYLWEGSDPSYTVDGRTLVPSGNGAVRLSNEGSISVSFNSPTAIALSCVASHELNNDWAAVTAGFEYMPIAVAPDSDGDGVYDINDDCEGVAGSEDTGGCPDSDGDGVKDSSDQYPNNPSCTKDSDGDGTCDGEDAFPSDPTKSSDSDGDGVADSADRCPTQSGSSQFNGCPDSDGDGVPDNQDNCPYNGDQGFGITENGCPVSDSDSDGVPDDSDQCGGTPSDASVDSTGCPVDSDRDGVVDYRDSCPNQGSTGHGVNSSGCPVRDADTDGVTNNADQCPDTWGSKVTGCPTIIDSIVNTLNLRGVL